MPDFKVRPVFAESINRRQTIFTNPNEPLSGFTSAIRGGIAGYKGGVETSAKVQETLRLNDPAKLRADQLKREKELTKLDEVIRDLKIDSDLKAEHGEDEIISEINERKAKTGYYGALTRSSDVSTRINEQYGVQGKYDKRIAQLRSQIKTPSAALLEEDMDVTIDEKGNPVFEQSGQTSIRQQLLRRQLEDNANIKRQIQELEKNKSLAASSAISTDTHALATQNSRFARDKNIDNSFGKKLGYIKELAEMDTSAGYGVNSEAITSELGSLLSDRKQFYDDDKRFVASEQVRDFLRDHRPSIENDLDARERFAINEKQLEAVRDDRDTLNAWAAIAKDNELLSQTQINLEKAGITSEKALSNPTKTLEDAARIVRGETETVEDPEVRNLAQHSYMIAAQKVSNKGKDPFNIDPVTVDMDTGKVITPDLASSTANTAEMLMFSNKANPSLQELKPLPKNSENPEEYSAVWAIMDDIKTKVNNSSMAQQTTAQTLTNGVRNVGAQTTVQQPSKKLKDSEDTMLAADGVSRETYEKALGEAVNREVQKREKRINRRLSAEEKGIIFMDLRRRTVNSRLKTAFPQITTTTPRELSAAVKG